MTPVSLLLLGSLSAAFILVSANKLPQTTTTIDCGPDKEYRECGSACPPDCTHPNGYNCTEACTPGCFCKEGFVELFGQCIEKEKCESCSGNYTYTPCSSPCQDTCTKTYTMFDFCAFRCLEGCICNGGYVFTDASLTKCILREECPKTPITGAPTP